MGDIKVFGVGFFAFIADYLSWVPDFIKLLILCATGVYVVFRALREINKYRLERLEKKTGETGES